MKPLVLVILGFLAFALSGCSLFTSQTTNLETQVAATIAAGETATVMMEQAFREISQGQTATAAINQAVSDALTAAAPVPTDTLQPSDTPIPTDTSTPTLEFTLTPSDTPTETPTLTFTPSQTPVVTPKPCFKIIDNWCNSHSGCATVDVRNNSGMSSTWHVWSDKLGVDSTFTIPPGVCILMTESGRYDFYITYCGSEVAEFSWQLNDFWLYKISPCD